MAEVILLRTDRNQVRRLADGIISAERTEFAFMQEFLRNREPPEIAALLPAPTITRQAWHHMRPHPL
jgi:hypothetical protein